MFEVKRPTLMVDKSRVLANIRWMKHKTESHSARFRPHFKTHQSGLIGEWFRDEGVEAITVSSAGMAEYFAGHGWKDITIAFPLNVRDMDAINRLASRIKLTLLLDHPQSARHLVAGIQHPVRVMVEVDVGHGRTGVPVRNLHAIAELADILNKNPLIVFAGLLTHAGQTYSAKGIDAVQEIAFKAFAEMDNLRKAIGRPQLLLSWGDTPSCSMLNQLPPFDEWRPGNFVFFDVMQYHIGACRLDQVAVALFCPVVGVYPDRHQVVVHAGAVHLSKDFIAAEADFRHYGFVVKPFANGWSEPIPGAWLASLSQEHGMIQFLPNTNIPFKIGDILGILPVHSCLTADAMRRMITTSGELIPMLPASLK